MATESKVTLESLVAEILRLRADGDSWVRQVKSEGTRLQDGMTAGVTQIGAESDARLASLKEELQILFQEIRVEFDLYRDTLRGGA